MQCRHIHDIGLSIDSILNNCVNNIKIIYIFIAMTNLYGCAQTNQRILIDPFPIEKWSIVSGSIIGVYDNGFIGRTGAQNKLSFGQFEYDDVIDDKYVVDVTIQRLSNDIDRPIEILFLGGAFGVADNSWYFYESDDHCTGWQFDNIISDMENKLSIVQNGPNISGYINEKYVGTFTIRNPVHIGKVSIYFEGEPNQPSTIIFKNFHLELL